MPRPLPPGPSWGDHSILASWSSRSRPTRLRLQCGGCGASARVARSRGKGPVRMMSDALAVLQSQALESCGATLRLRLVREVMDL